MTSEGPPTSDFDSGADQYFTSFNTGIVNSDGMEIYKRVIVPNDNNSDIRLEFCSDDRIDIRFAKWGLVTLTSIFAGTALYFLNEFKDSSKDITNVKVEIAKLGASQDFMRSNLDKVMNSSENKLGPHKPAPAN